MLYPVVVLGGLILGLICSKMSKLHLAGNREMRLGGFEPPSFGLEVEASRLEAPDGGWSSRTVERHRLELHRALWGTVVDPALTLPVTPRIALEPRSVFPRVAARAHVRLRWPSRRPAQTVRDIHGAHVIEMSAIVENDRITMFRSTVDIAFGVER